MVATSLFLLCTNRCNYLCEVEHAAARIARLDLAIEEAVKLTPPKMRAVIEALQLLREWPK
jgi:hypothetical protein